METGNSSRVRDDGARNFIRIRIDRHLAEAFRQSDEGVVAGRPLLVTLDECN